MEPSSLGLLVGCFGVISVFCGSKYYVQQRRRAGQSGEKKEKAGEAATDIDIETLYERLTLLRVITFLLSFTAMGVWLLEPKPYVAGIVAVLACFCLWRAWLLRGRILERLRGKGNING